MTNENEPKEGHSPHGSPVQNGQATDRVASDPSVTPIEAETSNAESPLADTPPPVAPAQPAKAKKDWMGTLLMVAALAAIIWAAVAAYGAGWAMWSRSDGITQLHFAFYTGLGVAVIALLLIWTTRRRGWHQSIVKRGLSVLLGFGLCGYLASWWVPSVTLPALHDVSTSLADPPVFRTILLRDDLRDAIPGADNSEYQGLSPRQRWERIHQEAYPDIGSVRVEQSTMLLMEKAESLAIARGWDIADIDAVEGRMEARTTTTPMAYPHDIALRIRSAEGGSGSIVDMRSVSGEGKHDLGANAEIIRSFLADLSGTTSGAR